MSITVGTLSAVSAALSTPWSGAWIVDVDVDLDATGILPSGQVPVTIGTTVLLGTVDARAAARQGPIARLRVVGGGGGWDKDVSSEHFHDDAGVLSTLVVQATAAAAGEVTLQVDLPVVFGVDYTRTAGPAARVLPRDGWYVNQQGVTVIGPRPTIPMDATSITILSYDPLQNRAELASSNVIVPGTILQNDNFGPVTIRDVEQTFNADGSRAIAWCSESPSTRLSTTLAKFVREASRVDFTTPYLYRVVLQGVDGRVFLQAVTSASGVPDTLPISVWGPAGITAKVTPGTLVVVEFLNGDPARPIARSFDSTPPPIEIDLTAPLTTVAGALTVTGPITAAAVGATSIIVAGGTEPIAAAGPLLSALSAIGAALTTIAGAITPPSAPAVAAATAANTAIANAAAASKPTVLV